uniref:UMOD/GP2/OIT3-like D8C domain-containing protein n=1 Tax=Branchiostoma floridae TaxID=7739 RepID=C3ZVL3_BRAFL|eukprot:XP_002587436.1 hypothetical protein BRAFLDRAFT_238543 [Branchiostoma floridae]
MPTQAPPPRRCGTWVSIWMNGQHPSLADGEVSRQACGSVSDRDICHYQTTIHVRACSGGYYVYKLPAVPECWRAYCGVTVGE